MTREEDIVRSTVSAIAETVREAPPLRLSPAPAPGELKSAPRTRRLRSWLTPIAAAAAVLALAVSVVAVKNLHSSPAPTATGSRSAAARVPAYYVAPEVICKTCKSTRLVVGDTRTGAKLATFDPPRGTSFAAVSAAADDRTFVADTVGYPFYVNRQHVTWYLVTITPGAASPARITRLRIPNTPAPSLVGTIALSPSGSELAVTYLFNKATPETAELRVYSVATGKLLNSWPATSGDIVLSPFDFAPNVESNNLLSWVDGGRAVSFTSISYPGGPFQRHFVADVAVRALNVTARGGDLIRDSRVIWSTQYSGNEPTCADGFNVPRLSTDGETVVCAEGDDFSAGTDPSGKRVAFPLKWLAYRTSEPKAARTLYKYTAYTTGSHPESLTSVQWADASGSTLIVAWFAESTTFSALHFGVISHGTLTPLPTPPGISLGTPPDVAW